MLLHLSGRYWRRGGAVARLRVLAGHGQEDLMASTINEPGRWLALDTSASLRTRSLDDSHVQALAGSIALQGMLVEGATAGRCCRSSLRV
jgi:hypothetical protein